MNTPTGTQISEEIKKLETMKPKVLRCSAFGEDHHEAIDAQIEVLETDYDEDTIYDKSAEEGDEDAEDKWPENVRDAALEARRWLDGEAEGDKSPSDNWQPLVQK